MHNLQLIEAARSVINHSRTLSLSLYEHELIYCKIQGCSYYYRAKYHLLFIFVQEARESIDFTINIIDLIILRVIKLYEVKCEKINFSYKLPRIINKYEQNQLARLGEEIEDIICCVNLDLPLLRKDSAIVEEKIAGAIANRTSELKQIEEKARDMKLQPSLFERYTARNVSRYKLKIFFFSVLLLSLLLLSGTLYCYHTSRIELL
jgi:hypothetical protein